MRRVLVINDGIAILSVKHPHEKAEAADHEGYELIRFVHWMSRRKGAYAVVSSTGM